MAAASGEPAFSVVYAGHNLGELSSSLQIRAGEASQSFLDAPRTRSSGALLVQRSLCPAGHDYRSTDFLLERSVPGRNIPFRRSTARKTFRKGKTGKIARNAAARADFRRFARCRVRHCRPPWSPTAANLSDSLRQRQNGQRLRENGKHDRVHRLFVESNDETRSEFRRRARAYASAEKTSQQDCRH